MHSICQQVWKTQQWPQDWIMSVLIPISEKCSIKECLNPWTIALISHASKVMLKILHASLQHYVNQELRNQRSNCQHSPDHRESKGIKKKKKHVLVLLTTLKPLTVRTIPNCGKLLNGNTRLFICILRNLYVGQETTVRTLYGTSDWFSIEKGV